MSDALAPKEIFYGDDGLDKLAEGVKAVHDAVGATMGPLGQFGMYEGFNVYPTVTKDGVSVASMIAFKDKVKDMGAQFVIQAARTQVRETGDGTTLTAVLTHKIFSEGRKLIAAGYSPKDIIDGISEATNAAVLEIVCDCVGADKIGLNELKMIALTSTNNDEDIANIIAEATHKTGVDGMVEKKRSQEETHSVLYQEGYQLSTGIQFAEFTTDKKKSHLNMDKPFVIVTDHDLVSFSQFNPIIKLIKAQLKEGAIPEIVLICPSIDGDVLKTMSLNINSEGGEVFMVHINPSVKLGTKKARMILEDIAAITGATFISQSSGYQIARMTMEQVGTCGNIMSDRDKTLFSGYTTGSRPVAKRIEYLKAQKDLIEDPQEKKFIKESLASINASVAIIYVGGKNISERDETWDRVDDGVRACLSALEMGYVRGGGVAMVIASSNIAEHGASPGYNVIVEALEYPMEVIIDNSNRRDAQLLINSIEGGHLGYDLTKDINNEPSTDMYDLNIIDPTKVIVYALKNAVSSAVLMLNTKVMIVEDTE